MFWWWCGYGPIGRFLLDTLVPEPMVLRLVRVEPHWVDVLILLPDPDPISSPLQAERVVLVAVRDVKKVRENDRTVCGRQEFTEEINSPLVLPKGFDRSSINLGLYFKSIP